MICLPKNLILGLLTAALAFGLVHQRGPLTRYLKIERM
jgi:hypothetical protein